MSEDITLGDLLERCPFRSVIGAHGSDLLGRSPGAVIAAPRPGMVDPAPALIEAAIGILRAGGTVLVLAADPADRVRIRHLLGAIQPVQWGHA